MQSSKLKDDLQAQLIDVQRLIKTVGGHPFMVQSLKVKEAELIKEIESLSQNSHEAKIILFFSGAPVFGSMGIDASFTGKIVPPFQKMVYSSFWQKNAKTIRGKTAAQKNNISKLYLTALPRGSFGLELQKLRHDDLFEESMVAETLEEITDLISASAKSDEDFDNTLSETPVKTIRNLREFLNIVSTEHAGVTIQTEQKKVELTNEDAKSAFERVNATVIDEDTIKVEGTLRGLLLDSWRFDFQPTDGKAMSGKISDEVSESDLQSYLKNYIDVVVVAEFEQSTIVFKTSKKRIIYKLRNIVPKED